MFRPPCLPPLLADAPALPPGIDTAVVAGITLLVGLVARELGPLVMNLLTLRQKNRTEDEDRTLGAAWKMLDRQKAEIDKMAEEVADLREENARLHAAHARLSVDNALLSAHVDRLEDMLRAAGIQVPARRTMSEGSGIQTPFPISPPHPAPEAKP